MFPETKSRETSGLEGKLDCEKSLFFLRFSKTRVVICVPRAFCSTDQEKRETARSLMENKTNWFPEGPDIKCFVIFLDFHFNSNKRITGANQNSRLGTYNNTNLILKTTE